MGKYSKISEKGVIGKFYNALAQDLGLSVIPLLSTLFPSDQKTETYAWLGQVPQMREWIGGRLVKALREYSHQISNVKYEASINVPNDDLRRDKTGILDIRMADLAKRTTAHWYKLISDLIIAGEAGLCYDGLYYFAANHDEGDSGTQKNLLTNGEVAALNVTTPAAPTANEMADAILGVFAYMLTYKDDQGESMNDDASKFLVMCGTPAIYSAALQAIKKNNLSTGAGVRDNPLKDIGLDIKVVLNNRLAAWTEQFGMFRTDVRTSAFILQEEDATKAAVLGAGSDHEFKEDEILVGVKAVRGAGYGYWQFASKSTLS